MMLASFTKRGKTWEYRINRIVGGKRKPLQKGGFATKKEAMAAATEVESKLNKGITPHLKLEPIVDYFENWLDVFKPNISKNTRIRYLHTLKNLKEHFSGVYLQDITKRMYQNFLNKFGEKMARETVRKFHTHIRACVKDAIDEGIIFVDFTRGVTITGEIATKRKEDKYLSYEDSQLLIEALKKDMSSMIHYLILLALASGARFAELVGLTRKDFDFKNNQLKLNKTWGYRKSMHEGFGAMKTSQSIRTIRMDQETMKIFKDLFKRIPENITGLVFYKPDAKYKVYNNLQVNLVIENILNNLNVAPISIHGLRHTHASILLYKDVSIYYISERLGHKDVETTMKYYAHIINELRVKDENKSTKVFEQLMA
jgi:integrase